VTGRCLLPLWICRLAEECFILAAFVREPEAADELVKAGDDYLRCAALPTAPVESLALCDSYNAHPLYAESGRREGHQT
jgi:hypothetical protein